MVGDDSARIAIGATRLAYVCIYIYTYTHTYVYMYTLTYACICLYAYTYTYVNMYLHTHTHACMYVYLLHAHTSIMNCCLPWPMRLRPESECQLLNHQAA